jgi:hypothetical protein
MAHRGVRLQLKVNGQALLDVDSDALHFVAQLGGSSEAQPYEVLGGDLGQCRLGEHLVELFVTPVMLPDYYPDPPDDEDEGDDSEGAGGS